MKAPQTDSFKHLKSNTLVWTLLCGMAGLLILGVWLNGSNSSPQTDGASPAGKRFATGQASFMKSQPDTGRFSVYNNLSTGARADYVPPPPDELFGSGSGIDDPEAKGIIPGLVEDAITRPEPKPTHKDPAASRQRELYEKAIASGLGSSDNGHSRGFKQSSPMPDPYQQDIERYRRQREALAGGNPYQQNPPGQGFTHSDHSQISGEFTHPQTPYTLMEGTLIPAVLQTRINSQLPGNITAMINRDIYDSIKQKHLLIPRGTRLIGSYDERIVLNQSKIMLSWGRMIFPDGRSLRLPDLNSHDLQGTSGLKGKVNNHFWKIFGQSAMLSLIGAGVNSASPQDFSFSRQQSVSEAAAEQIAQDFNRVSNQVLQRNLMMAPEITIPYGEKFTIFLAGDISFAEPYTTQYPPE